MNARRRKIWTVALVLGGLVLLWPPWSSVGYRISADGYGPLIVGPVTFDFYSYFTAKDGNHRIDLNRLLVHLALIAAVAAVVDRLWCGPFPEDA